MFAPIFTSVFFILTGSVMAQAASPHAQLGIAKVETSKWLATHAGNAEIDGLSVVASLETLTHEIEIPKELANQMNTLVPLAPMKKKNYRMVFTAVENPTLQAKFDLVGRNVSIDGVVRFAYINANEAEFQFLIVPNEDGTLQAKYVRQIATNQFEEGEIQLNALATIL